MAVLQRVTDVNEKVKYKTGPKAASTADTPTDFTPPARSAPDESQENAQAGRNVLAAKTDRCWFRVMSGSRPDEKGPVFAAINGESVLIKRNHWVELPTRLLPVFEDAVSSEVIIDSDGKNSVVRDVPRFNYEVRTVSQGKPKENQVIKGF